MNNRKLDCKITIYKFCRISAVCKNTSNFCRGHKYIIRFFLIEESFDFRLFTQIQLLVSSDKQITESFVLKSSEDSRTNKAGVPGNIYLRSLIHPATSPYLCHLFSNTTYISFSAHVPLIPP